MGRVQGKVAIIFGAAGGIGGAAAQLFAAEGAAVMLVDAARDTAEELRDRIVTAGGLADMTKADVTSAEEVKAAMNSAVARFDRLDILYNCVGGSSLKDGRIEDVADEEFWRTIRVDLYGTWLVCKHGIPLLVAGGGGSVVNMASAAAVRGPLGVNAYAAAKGGVIALTRALAVGYAADKVRVNAIAPAAVRTPRVESFLRESESVRRNLEERQPLGIVEPIEVAELALYLASDEARVVTGQILSIDGGYSA